MKTKRDHDKREQKSLGFVSTFQTMAVNFKRGLGSKLAWGAKIGPVNLQPHLARWRLGKKSQVCNWFSRGVLIKGKVDTTTVAAKLHKGC